MSKRIFIIVLNVNLYDASKMQVVAFWDYMLVNFITKKKLKTKKKKKTPDY